MQYVPGHARHLDDDDLDETSGVHDQVAKRAAEQEANQRQRGRRQGTGDVVHPVGERHRPRVQQDVNCGRDKHV